FRCDVAFDDLPHFGWHDAAQRLKRADVVQVASDEFVAPALANGRWKNGKASGQVVDGLREVGLDCSPRSFFVMRPTALIGPVPNIKSATRRAGDDGRVPMRGERIRQDPLVSRIQIDKRDPTTSERKAQGAGITESLGQFGAVS